MTTSCIVHRLLTVCLEGYLSKGLLTLPLTLVTVRILQAF